jgi:hypothetical protein
VLACVPRVLALLLALLLALSTACGRPTTMMPGSGTQTLLVAASITAVESMDNATTTMDFGTDFIIGVMRAGHPVAGAQVTVTSPLGSLTLAERSPGSYAAHQTGYADTYGLSIVADTDHIDGAALSGPPFHVFSAPTFGQVVMAGQPLAVAWSPSGAQSATVQTRDYPERPIPDSGTTTVPGAAIIGSPGRTVDDRVSIRRANQLALAGGAMGSTLSVSVRNSQRFRVMAK